MKHHVVFKLLMVMYIGWQPFSVATAQFEMSFLSGRIELFGQARITDEFGVNLYEPGDLSDELLVEKQSTIVIGSGSTSTGGVGGGEPRIRSSVDLAIAIGAQADGMLLSLHAAGISEATLVPNTFGDSFASASADGSSGDCVVLQLTSDVGPVGYEVLTNMAQGGSLVINTPAGEPLGTSGALQPGLYDICFGISTSLGATGPGMFSASSNFDLLMSVFMLPSCDFDADGNCSITDLNAMLAEGPIAPGVAVTPQNERFDLTGDGIIDLNDRDEWLAQAAIENGFASPYKVGDANLDGVVDGVDFIVWNESKFTQMLLWNRGNFNGDAVNDGLDFILWNANRFTSSDAVNGVPEPSCLGLMIMFATGALIGRRVLRY